MPFVLRLSTGDIHSSLLDEVTLILSWRTMPVSTLSKLNS